MGDKTNNTPYGFGQWFRVKSLGRKNFGELWMRVMPCFSQGVETSAVNLAMLTASQHLGGVGSRLTPIAQKETILVRKIAKIR